MENLLKMEAEGLKENCNSNNILLAPGSPFLLRPTECFIFVIITVSCLHFVPLILC